MTPVFASRQNRRNSCLSTENPCNLPHNDLNSPKDSPRPEKSPPPQQERALYEWDKAKADCLKILEDKLGFFQRDLSRSFQKVSIRLEQSLSERRKIREQETKSELVRELRRTSNVELRLDTWMKKVKSKEMDVQKHYKIQTNQVHGESVLPAMVKLVGTLVDSVDAIREREIREKNIKEAQQDRCDLEAWRYLIQQVDLAQKSNSREVMKALTEHLETMEKRRQGQRDKEMSTCSIAHAPGTENVLTDVEGPMVSPSALDAGLFTPPTLPLPSPNCLPPLKRTPQLPPLFRQVIPEQGKVCVGEAILPKVAKEGKEDEVEEINLPVEESKDIKIERNNHSRLAWNEGQVKDEEDEEKGQQPEIFKKKFSSLLGGLACCRGL